MLNTLSVEQVCEKNAASAVRGLCRFLRSLQVTSVTRTVSEAGTLQTSEATVKTNGDQFLNPRFPETRKSISCE